MTLKFAVPMLMLALAGCSRSAPEAPAVPDTVEEVTPPTPTSSPVPSATSSPTPQPIPSPTPVPPPAAEIAANEQMLDDASATGMTARADRDKDATDAPAAADPEVQ